MDKSDTDALRDAVRLLEHASLAARVANMIGKPVELVSRALPAGASQAIATAAAKSLEAALKVALLGVRRFFAAFGAARLDRHHLTVNPRYRAK